MTNIRFHFEDRLSVPEPDFVMFGARLNTGRVRVWASQELDRATLASKITRNGTVEDLFDPRLFMPSPAERITLTTVMDNVVMIEDDTYAAAFNRLARFFNPDEPTEDSAAQLPPSKKELEQ